MAKHFYINLSLLKGSRYGLEKFLDFSDNYDPITSDFLLSISKIKTVGTYRVEGEDARPDLISYELFNSEQYWWILMFYNGIVRVDALTNGTVLKVPDLDEMEDVYFTLKSRELGR